MEARMHNEYECRKCGTLFRIFDDREPTLHCHDCAHIIADAVVTLAASWDKKAQRPNCTDRMRKRALRECRDELLAIIGGLK